jgi:hypothetical protein
VSRNGVAKTTGARAIARGMAIRAGLVEGVTRRRRRRDGHRIGEALVVALATLTMRDCSAVTPVACIAVEEKSTIAVTFPRHPTLGLHRYITEEE